MSDGGDTTEQPTGAAATPPPPPPPPPGAPPRVPTPPPPGGGGGAGASLGGGRRAGLVPLHPLSLGDIVDSAFKLFRATAVPAMLTVAIAYGPLGLLIALPSATVDVADTADPFAGMSPAALALSGLGWFVTALVAPLVTAAVTWMALRREEGEQISWQDAYRAAWGRFGRILLAFLWLSLVAIAVLAAAALPVVGLGMLHVALGVVLGIAVLVPLTLGFAAVYYLAVPLIIIEEARAWPAVKRAWGLVRQRFWPIAGVVLVSGILIGIIGAIVSIGFGFIGVLAGPLRFVFEAIGTTASSMVTVPLTANVALLLYLDQRIRSEGLDIEILTAELARAR